MILYENLTEGQELDGTVVALPNLATKATAYTVRCSIKDSNAREVFGLIRQGPVRLRIEQSIRVRILGLREGLHVPMELVAGAASGPSVAKPVSGAGAGNLAGSSTSKATTSFHPPPGGSSSKVVQDIWVKAQELVNNDKLKLESSDRGGGRKMAGAAERVLREEVLGVLVGSPCRKMKCMVARTVAPLGERETTQFALKGLVRILMNSSQDSCPAAPKWRRLLGMSMEQEPKEPGAQKRDRWAEFCAWLWGTADLEGWKPPRAWRSRVNYLVFEGRDGLVKHLEHCPMAAWHEGSCPVKPPGKCDKPGAGYVLFQIEDYLIDGGQKTFSDLIHEVLNQKDLELLVPTCKPTECWPS